MDAYISYTQISDYLRCPKRYQFRLDGLEKTNESLVFGAAVHLFLEDYFKKSPNIRDRAVEYLIRNGYLSSVFKLEKLMMDFVELNPLKGYEVLETESEFSVEILTGVYFVGKIDLILQDVRGNIYLVDHKVTRSVPDFLVYDRQIAMYILYSGRKVDKVLYNVLVPRKREKTQVILRRYEKPNERYLRIVKKEVEHVIKLIRTQDFFPRNFNYSCHFECPYYSECLDYAYYDHEEAKDED